jgi:hypothetical protein
MFLAASNVGWRFKQPHLLTQRLTNVVHPL